jgi:hypothetical protein
VIAVIYRRFNSAIGASTVANCRRKGCDPASGMFAARGRWIDTSEAEVNESAIAVLIEYCQFALDWKSRAESRKSLRD